MIARPCPGSAAAVRRRFSVLLPVLLFPLLLHAQDSTEWTDGFARTDGMPTRKVVATTAVGGLLVGSLVSSYYDWWKGSDQRFHFLSEGVFHDYSLGIDKIGHAYTSYFYFNSFRHIMLWGGYGRSAAFWWATGTTAFFALSIEIGDGLSPYGFSFEDLGFNLVGLGFGMLQAEFPVLRNVQFKWSYVPLDGYRWPPRFTDHYDGHTYWLAFNMHRLLPEGVGEYWPEFLQLAVGYGVGDKQTRREFAVGVDFNLGCFSTESPDVRLLQRTIDLIHLPGPGVKFSPGKGPDYRLFLLN